MGRSGLACAPRVYSKSFIVPIYAYKCSACGYAHDTLQKMSDAPLTVCPECHQSTYVKQVTAAGFQLKGSGWYVTDFRDKGTGAAKTAEPAPVVAKKDGVASSEGSASVSASADTAAAPAGAAASTSQSTVSPSTSAAPPATAPSSSPASSTANK